VIHLLPKAANWHYLPYGSRTLKFQIDAPAGAHLAWLRPLHRHANPHLVACHEDDHDNLLITWGGGDKRGYRLDFSAGDRFAYLHVTHRAGRLADRYHVTVILETDAGDVFRQGIWLHCPQVIDPLQATWEAIDPNLSRITFDGQSLPVYQSRWWPRSQVWYRPLAAPPPVQIEYRRSVDGVFGAIRVLWRHQPLAEVTGHLDLPLHDARLFAANLFDFFDNRYWVLRLWFQWLHTHFEPSDLLGAALVQRTWAVEDPRVVEANALNALLDRGEREEVPDIERFDLLLDTATGQVVYAGTDLHWQEFWGPAPREAPVQAEILPFGLKKAVYSVALYLRGRNQRLTRPPSYEPAAILQQRTREEVRAPHTRLEPYMITRLPVPLENHVPFVNGLHFDSDLISGDVRRAREAQRDILSMVQDVMA